MSSVAVEASLNGSNRSSAPRSGGKPAAERQDGFATLVDSNLPASSRNQPRSPSAADDPAVTRRPVPAESPQSERQTQPPAEGGTRIERSPQAESSANTAAQTTTDATDNKDDAGDPAANAPDPALVTSVVSADDAIPVVNPPATVVPTPAETAAAALSRVAADTAPPVAAATAAGAEATTETAAAALPTEIKPEGDIKADTVSAQVDAKAQNELASPAKATDAKPGTVEHGQFIRAAEDAKPNGDPKPVEAAPDPRKPGTTPDARSSTQPHLAADRSDVETPKPARATASDANVTAAPAHTQSASDLLQPNGFGVAHTTAPQVAAPAQMAQLTAVAASSVPVPLNGLAVEIVANAQIGRSRFEIRLDPPELGRIDVKLDVDRHGQVTSHLIVEKSSTLDMLRRDAPQLERALQDAGLKTSDSGLQFSLRDQSQSQRNDDNDTGRNAHRLHIIEDDQATPEPATRSYGRMIGARGGIDIRV